MTLRGGFGIAEHCSELTIRELKVSLSIKDFKVEGRTFEKVIGSGTECDSSTGCLRMTSEVLSLVKYLSNLQMFAVTFGLHQKKQMSTSFTIDTVITRIQEAYDFDCQCIDQVKAFLGTEAQTQGP